MLATERRQKAMAEQVKAEFLHAWDGYKQYCWGHDDLKPISKTCRDWYGTDDPDDAGRFARLAVFAGL